MDTPANQQLRRAAKAAARRNKRIRQTLDGGDFSGAMRLIAANENKPAHYHIIYHVPSADVVLPHFRVAYRTKRAVMLQLRDLGMQSEPRTEWYDNGMVGIETTMPGRSGLWFVLLEAAGCVATECRPEEMIREPRGLLPDTSTQPHLRVVTNDDTD